MSGYYKFEKNESGVTCRAPSGGDLLLFSPETCTGGISPDWGAISKGSHCLSFSILRHALGENNSVHRLYEPFCADVLAKLELKSWQIKEAQVSEFIDWKNKSLMRVHAICSTPSESPECTCLESYQKVPKVDRPGWLNDVNVSLAVDG
jgi:hypothetical protein